MDRTCPICQKIYRVYPSELERGRRLTCSIDCGKKFRAESTAETSKAIDRSCPVCGKIYKVYPSHLKQGKRLTCSIACGKKLRLKGKDRPLTNAERQARYREKRPVDRPKREIPIEFNGKTQSLARWAIDTGIPYPVLQARKRYGWSIDRMLTTPVKKLR